MVILSWVGIFCIVYVVMSIITFGNIITEIGLEDDGNPLMLVLGVLMLGLACLLAVVWPVYWFVQIKDKITGDK